MSGLKKLKYIHRKIRIFIFFKSTCRKIQLTITMRKNISHSIRQLTRILILVHIPLSGCSMPACSLAQASPHVSPIVSEDECSCQCNTEWPTYREDTATCVDTVKGEDTALARNKSHAYYYRMSASRVCDWRID